jgi:hypothetical protein
LRRARLYSTGVRLAERLVVDTLHERAGAIDEETVAAQLAELEDPVRCRATAAGYYPARSRNLPGYECLDRSVDDLISAFDQPAVAAIVTRVHRTVHARIDNLDVEIRVLETPTHAGTGLGDRMAAAGRWRGETEEEILEILREARRTGSSEDPPQMP